MHSRWTSRKFLMAVASVLLVVITDMAGVEIEPQTYWSVIGLVIAYITGEAYVDSRKP